jgi:hypothetical protein
LLINASLFAIAVILAVTPANALPEQNISTVVKWAKTRPNLANDFQKSRYVTKVGRDQFYHGQKFACISVEVQGGSALQIIPLNKLQEFIDNCF